MASEITRVDIGSAELTLLVGKGEVAERVENVDAYVRLVDGSRWSATVISLPEIARIMERWRATGEYLGGRYFTCPDLVIVREGGIANIIDAFKEIMRTGGPEGILQRVE